MPTEVPGPDLIFQSRDPEIDRSALGGFAARLSAELAGGAGFTCLFTGDRKLRDLNRQFLNHDYPTDVLSFPEPGPDGHLGEIAVSVARAKAQAAEFGHTLDEELKILLLHGVLHLLGHDHENDRGGMRRVETRWRKKLGLTRGLIERRGK